MLNVVGHVTKTWGHERILHSTDNFCVKELHFPQRNNYFSYHVHKNKLEEWTVRQGAFRLEWSYNAAEPAAVLELKEGDVFTVTPGMYHKLTALQDTSCMLEVSTADHQEDNHRLLLSMP